MLRRRSWRRKRSSEESSSITRVWHRHYPGRAARTYGVEYQVLGVGVPMNTLLTQCRGAKASLDRAHRVSRPVRRPLRWQTGGGSWGDEDPRVHVDEAGQEVALPSLPPRLGYSVPVYLSRRSVAITERASRPGGRGRRGRVENAPEDTNNGTRQIRRPIRRVTRA